jgi:hypothetical protein
MRTLPLALVLAACSLPVVGDGDLATEVRNLDPSTAVRLAGPFDLTVQTDGDLDVAEITCDSNVLPHIVTRLEGDELVVRVAQGTAIRPSTTCQVALKLSRPPERLAVSGSGVLDAQGRLPALREVQVSGSGHLSLADGADVCDLEARVSGSGDLDLGELAGCALEARVSGSGSLFGEGAVRSVDVDLSGSGELVLDGLVAEEAEIDVSGSGRGWFTVLQSVDARISGSGRVIVYGSPVTRDVAVSGSGDVAFE